MVSLTSLLVLVSLFSQTTSNIPKTAYMKLIDIWFLALIVMDFFVILIVVVIEFVRLKGHVRDDNSRITDLKKAIVTGTKSSKVSPQNIEYTNLNGNIDLPKRGKNLNWISPNQSENENIKAKDQTVAKLNSISRYGFPIMYAVFISIFAYEAINGIMM